MLSYYSSSIGFWWTFLNNYKSSCTKVICRKLHYNRNILTLRERGMYYDIFPETASTEITELLVKSGEPQCVYAGFDPTAKSLHIGNLLVLVNLLHWQRAGHKVIAVIGGATAVVGDPSGKLRDRDKPDVKKVKENAEFIKRNILTIFNNHKKHFWDVEKRTIVPITVLNNNVWYEKMNVVTFMNEVGRHFRMGKMLLKESVASRLKSEFGMNFTEFSYQIFQAYDWLHLYHKYDCRFQVGGSDQMGNIVAGHNLIGKILDKPVYGLTVPLITSVGGDKFGKTSGNTVWLDPEMTSPFDLYQYLIRLPDDQVENLLKLLTFNTVPHVNSLMREHVANPEKRVAQKKLADDVTLLIHGPEGLERAKIATTALYDNDLTALAKLDWKDISGIFEAAPVVTLQMTPGLTVLNLALEAKCFLTEGDARRIIEAGGFYINHSRITNTDEVVSKTIHILPNNISLLRVGKRNYCVVRWT